MSYVYFNLFFLLCQYQFDKNIKVCKNHERGDTMKKIGTKKTLPELVANQIIDYINENQLQANDKLPNEAKLMQQLNVGRGTIREAIKILNSKGIVVIKRGIGTFVAEQIGISDDPLGFNFENDKIKLLQDALELRLLIEPQIISKTIDNITDKQIAELEIIIHEIESLINKNEDYTQKDVAFHTLLASISGNQIIKKLMPIIAGAIEQVIYVTDKSLIQETIIQHREILNAIKNHDKQNASEAMKKHIQDNIARVQLLAIQNKQ